MDQDNSEYGHFLRSVCITFVFCICLYYPQFSVDLVTFTEKILKRKLHFVRNVIYSNSTMETPQHFVKSI